MNEKKLIIFKKGIDRTYDNCYHNDII